MLCKAIAHGRDPQAPAAGCIVMHQLAVAELPGLLPERAQQFCPAQHVEGPRLHGLASISNLLPAKAAHRRLASGLGLAAILMTDPFVRLEGPPAAGCNPQLSDTSQELTCGS